MTQLLEEAVRKARELSIDMQDEIARMIMSLAGRDSLVDISAEDERAVLASREAAARDEFATDEQLRAIRAKWSPSAAARLTRPRAPSPPRPAACPRPA